MNQMSTISIVDHIDKITVVSACLIYSSFSIALLKSLPTEARLAQLNDEVNAMGVTNLLRLPPMLLGHIVARFNFNCQVM